jgi:hypothetical protein
MVKHSQERTLKKSFHRKISYCFSCFIHICVGTLPHLCQHQFIYSHLLMTITHLNGFYFSRRKWKHSFILNNLKANRMTSWQDH